MPAPLRHFLLRHTPLAVCLCSLVMLVGCATVTPSPDGQKTTLQVCSNPSGARIILDGTATNFRTPTSVPGMTAGPHRILLSLRGHRNWERRIDVAPGKISRVEAILEPVATGRLRVVSVPADAEVLLDGEPTAFQTPAELIGIPVGTHTVQVQRDGYASWSQAVVILPDRRLEVPAILTPSRKDWGHIRVQSHPPHARISLDGYPTGKSTPDKVYNVQAGNHRLELAVDGHRPWSGAVTIREGQTEDVLVKLQPLPLGELGGARLESDPPGAAITINGALVQQKTPADLQHLAIGPATIEMTLPGYRVWRGKLTIVPGERTLLAVKLNPEDRYGGSLRVESDPAGAAITIDDQPTGMVTPALLPNLSPASHRVALTLPGHRESVRMISIPVGGTATMNVRLVHNAHRIAARILEVRGEDVELEFSVHDELGTPGEGTLSLFLASSATWQTRPANIPISAGRARVQIKLAEAIAEASLTVGVDEERAVFRLRRAAERWEIVSEE